MERVSVLLSLLALVVGLLGGFRWALEEWRIWRHRKRTTGRWLVLLLCLLPTPAYAVPWSDIMTTDRGTDWTYAGVQGGPVTARTQCGSTIAAYGTSGARQSAATINTVISACGANQYVQLGVGTFWLNSGVSLSGKNNITLRGMGPDLTILNFSGGNGCITSDGAGGGINSFSGLVCVNGIASIWAGDCLNLPGGCASNPDQVANTGKFTTWTGNFSQNSTQILVASTAGITAGTVIVMDQCDETVDDGGITNSAYGSIFLNEAQTRGRHSSVGPAACPSSAPRSLEEFHRVVSVDSGTQLTITPPVIMPTWRSSQSPQVWWLGTATNTFITGTGVEDLTIDGRAQGSVADIMFMNAFGGWATNVRLIGWNRGAISYRQAAQITSMSSYFYGSNSFTAESYVQDILSGSSLLMINNICHFVVSCTMGPAPGRVFAYNYGLNFPLFPGSFAPPANQGGIFPTHDSGGGEELYEGNEMNGAIADFPHGQSPLLVWFRNYFRTADEGFTPNGNRKAFDFQSFARGYTVVGNVLGLSGTSTFYECNVGALALPAQNCPASSGDRVIYQYGANRGGSTPNDPVVGFSLMRWGNFDLVTNTARFLAAEVPTVGILRLSGNPVPATTNLPQSFFLSGKPTTWWNTPWGEPAFPPIGPDVTGGTYTVNGTPDSGLGGRVWMIPAKLCYLNSPIDTVNYPGGQNRGVLLFNANNCYLASTPTPPAPAPPIAIAFGRVLHWFEILLPICTLGWHFRRQLLAVALICLTAGSTLSFAVFYAKVRTYQVLRGGAERVALVYLDWSARKESDVRRLQ